MLNFEFLNGGKRNAVLVQIGSTDFHKKLAKLDRINSRCAMTNPKEAINEDEIEDPVEKMLQKTGCAEFHYQLQDCVAETRDWRKCQKEVTEFKTCMAKYSKEQEEKYSKQ